MTHPLICPRGHAQATAESAERSLRVLAGQSVDEAGKNASRNMHSQLKSLGHSLPIDIHPVEHCSEAGEIQTITTYHIKPSSWIRHWMSESPEILGGCGGGTRVPTLKHSGKPIKFNIQDMLFFGTIWTT